MTERVDLTECVFDTNERIHKQVSVDGSEFVVDAKEKGAFLWIIESM